MVEAGIFMHLILNLVEYIKSEYGMVFMVRLCNSSVIQDRPLGWFSSGPARVGAALSVHMYCLLTMTSQGSDQCTLSVQYSRDQSEA